MLFADLLSLHLVTFLMFFILAIYTKCTVLVCTDGIQLRGIYICTKCTVLVWSDRYLLVNNQPLTQCTGLTSGVSVYPNMEALCYITGIRYVTAEDPCCGTLRVAVEK